ncbi:MAG: polysaccharide deacetylase family protein [Phycisphaerales bacterium]|nr:polysaccharide deacetylase family protein [Phycisphaerales bacterium]
MSLRDLVNWLKDHYQIVSYSRAVELVQRGPIEIPYLAISFDDGFSTHVNAADVLHDLGVSACFFVCPSVIGIENDSQRESFCRDQLKVDPTHFLSWAEIERMIEQGHEIGSHTFSHHDLSCIPHEQGMEEILRAQKTLMDRLGECKHFAWPYGRFAAITPELVRAAFDAGHLSCASTEHGWHGEDIDQPRSLCIRREPVECDWSKARLTYALTKRLRYRAGSQSGWPKSWGSTIRPAARQDV